jgi:hypothetical protein
MESDANRATYDDDDDNDDDDDDDDDGGGDSDHARRGDDLRRLGAKNKVCHSFLFAPRCVQRVSCSVASEATFINFQTRLRCLLTTPVLSSSHKVMNAIGGEMTRVAGPKLLAVQSDRVPELGFRVST